MFITLVAVCFQLIYLSCRHALTKTGIDPFLEKNWFLIRSALSPPEGAETDLYGHPLWTPVAKPPHALGQNARDFFFEPVVDTRWQKTRC